jgi:cell division transport system permease protein
MNRKPDLTYIGLTKIWAEGQGVDRTSKRALTLHIIRRAWENVRRSPITASLTTITITISLFLLGLFALLLQNTSSSVSEHSTRVGITLFLTEREGAPALDAVKSDVQKFLASQSIPGASITTKTKSEALAMFREVLGEERDLLEGLDADNPLPASVEVELTDPNQAENAQAALRGAFAQDGRIESIRYSRGAVEQLKRIVRVIELSGGLGVTFLLVITAFIIANTIKLALYSHRIEVEIMQLVGATRSAIFTPYIIEGGAQGLVGALLSLLGVFCVYLFVGDSASSSELLHFIFPSFAFLSSGYVVIILSVGVVVGMIGSFFAVRRFVTED